MGLEQHSCSGFCDEKLPGIIHNATVMKATQKSKRHYCYGQVAKELALRWRQKLPSCIEFNIKQCFIETDGCYVGFKAVNNE